MYSVAKGGLATGVGVPKATAPVGMPPVSSSLQSLRPPPRAKSKIELKAKDEHTGASPSKSAQLDLDLYAKLLPKYGKPMPPPHPKAPSAECPQSEHDVLDEKHGTEGAEEEKNGKPDALIEPDDDSDGGNGGGRRAKDGRPIVARRATMYFKPPKQGRASGEWQNSEDESQAFHRTQFGTGLPDGAQPTEEPHAKARSHMSNHNYLQYR